MSEHEITSRINRNELLGLLHSTAMEKEMETDVDGDGWDDWDSPQPVTAKMPAVTLDRLLIPDELPAPPFVIRFRSPAGTNELYPITDPPENSRAPLTLPISDGAITDDIDPEVSTAIGRATSESLNATIDAAIDAAVDELAQAPVDVALGEAMAIDEERRTTAVIARVAEPERPSVLPMLCGFALTFMAGIGLMFLIS